ncbi:phosphoglycolate phosphatase [Salinarimonas soli]|uniref:Phosphoglycolate phosphatase n=1 Tax=Salinarimonas soli TaxID=1638099 RepID=A0A5B2VEJ7_9HYPH|nr:phosphoglycolate phosphatase [Salinarimonas soli]KAA2237036.1 phosphoglycolate phosphatase [Salinarimonas soli]
MAAPAHPIVVFDLDGTLADTAPDLIATLNAILADEGLAPLPLAEAGALIGVGARALIERGVASNGRTLPPGRLDILYAEFLERYAANVCVETRLYPGARAALNRLAGEGYRLAICTNKFESHARALLAALGVLDIFQALGGRDTFPVCKPDPRHLTLTITAAGGDPTRAVMVGDSRTDIVTARAAGIPVIAVPFGYTDVPIETLSPDRVISHFDELAEAVHRLVPLAWPQSTAAQSLGGSLQGNGSAGRCTLEATARPRLRAYR